MSRPVTLAILSDVHYASAAEQARGDDYELRHVTHPVTRRMLKTFRRFVWLHRPLRQNHLLDQFLALAGEPDLVVANGDYSCDSAFVGVSDDAVCASVRECLGRLRGKYGGRFHATIGDHELGKFSFIGRQGGLRLESFHRAVRELGLEAFWRVEIGRYVLIGLASSLVALPVYAAELLPEERTGWEAARAEHLAQLRAVFGALKPDQRVLLFSHDPTALPFLGREEEVRARLPQIEQTVIGHLHSNFIFSKSRVLAGMPVIPFLGHTARRMTTALREARRWRPFRVRLCPALAGVELLKDGGFLTAELDLDARQPARFRFHRIPR